MSPFIFIFHVIPKRSAIAVISDVYFIQTDHLLSFPLTSLYSVWLLFLSMNGVVKGISGDGTAMLRNGNALGTVGNNARCNNVVANIGLGNSGR